MTTLLWLRRDLRRHDLAALTAAHRDTDDDFAGVFVVDPALWDGAGRVRRGWLARSVLAAREAYDGKLALLSGDPRAGRAAAGATLRSASESAAGR